MSKSYMVSDGSYSSSNETTFCTDKLYVSVLDAVSHRDHKYTDARSITDTILAKIISQNRPVIKRNDLVQVAADILRRFDRTAYVRYISMR